MTNEEKYNRAKGLLKDLTEEKYHEYYARYDRLLAIESDSDNEEEREFLIFLNDYLKSIIVCNYMTNHGYNLNIKGIYPYWEKVDINHVSSKA